MTYSHKIFNLDKIAVNREKFFELKDYEGYTFDLLYKRLQFACKMFNLDNKLNHTVKIRKTIKGILIIKTFKMENKEKMFLETLLEKINLIAHDKLMFPSNSEYTSKGKLEISKTEQGELINYGLIYKNQDYTKELMFYKFSLHNSYSNNEAALNDVYSKLSKQLMFMLMFGEGSIKHDIPLIGDLVTKGEYWKEKVSDLKNDGVFVKYTD